MFHGCLRACGDDLGVVLRSALTMVHLQDPFQAAEFAMQLKVNPSKCKVRAWAKERRSFSALVRQGCSALGCL